MERSERRRCVPTVMVTVVVTVTVTATAVIVVMVVTSRRRCRRLAPMGTGMHTFN